MLAHFASLGGAIFDTAACEGFAFSKIAESLLGVGKDVIEPYVDQFLQAGKTVIAKDTWISLPETNKNAIMDATKELGLSIDDLKTRFDVLSDPKSNATTFLLTDAQIEAPSALSPLGMEIAMGPLREKNQGTAETSPSEAQLPALPAGSRTKPRNRDHRRDGGRRAE